MSRFNFALIFVIVLLGYFMLFEDVTKPWPTSRVPAEVERLERPTPEMIENPYDVGAKD